MLFLNNIKVIKLKSRCPEIVFMLLRYLRMYFFITANRILVDQIKLSLLTFDK